MSKKEHADKERGFIRSPNGFTVRKWPWTARQKRRAVGTRLTRKQKRKGTI